MKKFFKWVGIALVAFIIAGWFYIQWKYPDYSARYKLSLEVETPTGVKTGSSVLEASWITHIRILPDSGGSSSDIRGEALVAEVAPGKFLFVLLKADARRNGSWGPVSLAWYGANMQEINALKGRGASTRAAWHAANNMKGKRAVSPAHLPLLVTFTDINDPASVKRVDPYDLAAHFGTGVKLKAVTLEITREKVTQGEVEKVLGWLGEYYNKRLDGKRFGTVNTDNPFANSLSSGAFDTETD